MTIFFVTAFDGPTNCNMAVAPMMIQEGDCELFSQDATSANLIAELQAREADDLFVMTHGKPDHIKDNNNTEFLHATQGALIRNRKVFAWACFTGRRLGYYMSKNNAIWWGYDTPITAPDDSTEYRQIHAEMLSVAKIRFQQANNGNAINAVLNELRNAAEDAEERFYSSGVQNDPNADLFSIFSTCSQFWRSLVVWMDGHDEPFRHPLAPKPIIEL